MALPAALYRAITVFLTPAIAVIMLAPAGNAGLIRLAVGLVARLAAVRMLIAQQANVLVMLAGLLATAKKLTLMGVSAILAAEIINVLV